MRTLVLLVVLLLTACASKEPFEFEFDEAEEAPLKPVGYVDLNRYMGRWYMIANIPYFAEQGNLGVFVEYSRREDGLVDDLFTAQDAFNLPPFTKSGLIEITNPITGAEGRITFLRPIWQDFAILYLDDDYRHTIIGHPSRNYCWVFAREPRMSDELYKIMLAVLKTNDFDVSRVLKIPQKPEDLGAPGYQ